MINLSHVTFSYDPQSEDVTLSDVSLSIAKGETVGVIGHTGSGKSTLMQIICGLMKVTTGKLVVCGKNLTASKTPAAEIRGKIGLVFQYPEHQLFEETIWDDIAFGAKNIGLSEPEVGERVQEAMGLVGLSLDLKDASPFEISGGQKRRTAIAGVLAMHPDILILDEPTAGLDPVGRHEIFQSIVEFQEKYQTTVLFVSHSMEDVASVAKRVLVMDHGRLVMDGKTADVYADVKKLRSYGLDVPKINRIMTGLKSEGIPIQTNVLTVPEAISELSRVFGRDGV